MYVEGLNLVLHRVDENEPALIDAVLRDSGKEDYNLNALIFPYAELDQHLFPMTQDSLKGFCYKSR